MKHGTYVGPLKHLQGEGALLQETTKKGKVMAQFDNLDRLALGWHMFDEKDFDEDDYEKEGDFTAAFWITLIILAGIGWAVVGRLVS